VTRFRGTDEGERYRERVVVTRRTKVIQGVTTTVVSDVLRRADGSLAEKTRDWYAPDHHGNVWYFGESTATYDRHGHVDSREGSWQAGVHGAVAGTIMPAHPRPTDAYRQELYRGHAEDRFEVIALFRGVAGARAQRALLIRETTPLEPGVVDHKLYVRGVGVVLEQTEKGGDERNELVSLQRVP
jgi:hypothetical protein